MIDISNVKHILISRTDNIGDVILTLPLAGILKQQFPEIKVSFLGREYVRSIAEHCEYVDGFFSWDSLTHLSEDDLAKHFKNQHIDVVIHAFPNRAVATAMQKAKIKYRIGTTRRWYHWLTCNQRVSFSRAKSTLHEAQLNTRLLAPFHFSVDDSLSFLSEKIGLKCDEPLSPQLQSFLHPEKFNLIVHPFTNGNTREWPVSHFNALIRRMPADKVNVIVTGSKKEADMIEQRMCSQLKGITNAAGRCSLRELIQLIAHADGLVANSTGPLHMAAGLNIHALGLFPMAQGMSPARWMPLGKKAEVLTADPQCRAPACREKNDCICMESITVDAVASVILGWLD